MSLWDSSDSNPFELAPGIVDIPAGMDYSDFVTVSYTKKLMKTDNEHPEQKKQKRRSTLKTLVAGGGTLTLSALPSQWVKPVVDAVTLPAHAQTTGPAAALNGFNVQGQAIGLLDRIIPKAHASVASPPDGLLCIESAGAGWTASFDIGSAVLTGNGEIGNCETLACGGSEFFFGLRVVQANSNGSFDFELYASCPDVVLFIANTTNIPCSLGSCLEPA